MKKIRLILSLALVFAILPIGVYAAENAKNDDPNGRTAISAKREESLSAKLASSEISQEQYDEFISAIESGSFHRTWGNRENRANTEELTEEQKAELSAKRDEMLVKKLESGEITQEQYDEIIAGNGRVGGVRDSRGNRGDAEERTEGQRKTAERHTEELTDAQRAAIAEKRTEAAADGSFSNFRGGMRGNAGSRNK